jgi:monovalent cation/hydrogen antiporter
MESGCEHTRKADLKTKENADVCEECVKEGLRWVHLRVCLTCGHVGCCDSSIGKHATKHFKEIGHPVMAEFPGREWTWCYIDKTYG